MQEQDVIDAILALQRRERPDLDAGAAEVTGRVLRLGERLQQAVSEGLKPQGLRVGPYRVLAALRRSGAPYQLTPSALFRSLMVTSGGMSNLLERMQRDRLIERLPDPEDRRGVLVKLTSKGLATIDQAMTVNTRIEQQLLTGLDAQESKTLAALLRKLLLSLESNETAPS